MSEETLPDTIRGHAGFGSTGVSSVCFEWSNKITSHNHVSGAPRKRNQYCSRKEAQDIFIIS